MNSKISELNTKIELKKSQLEEFHYAIEYCKYDIGRQQNNIQILNRRTTSSDLKNMMPTIEQCEKTIKRQENNLELWSKERQELEQEIQDLMNELSELQK